MYVTEWVTPPSDIVGSFAWRATTEIDQKPSQSDKGTLVTKHGDVRQVWYDIPYDTFEQLRQASTAESFRSLFRNLTTYPADNIKGDISDTQCEWIRDLRGQGESFTVIYRHTGYPLDMLVRHAVGQCGCPVATKPQEEGNAPWKEEFVLEQLLESHGHLKTELAKLFDCTLEEVEEAMREHDLS